MNINITKIYRRTEITKMFQILSNEYDHTIAQFFLSILCFVFGNAQYNNNPCFQTEGIVFICLSFTCWTSECCCCDDLFCMRFNPISHCTVRLGNFCCCCYFQLWSPLREHTINNVHQLDGRLIERNGRTYQLDLRATKYELFALSNLTNTVRV